MRCLKIMELVMLIVIFHEYDAIHVLPVGGIGKSLLVDLCIPASRSI
jgi:hypothetical protein